MTIGPASEPQAAFARELQRVDESWRAWLATLDRVPARDVMTPGVCGDWSVKDLIGHIAIWDDVATRWAQAILDETPEPHIRDLDAFNAREADLRAERNITDLVAEMETNHARLHRALERALDGSPEAMARISASLETYTWGHYAEHRQHIDVALPPA